MNILDSAVEEIKRALIGNKSKDVNDVYLGNAIRYIEEYQKGTNERQPKQPDSQLGEALSALIAFTLSQNAVPSDIIHDFYCPNTKILGYEDLMTSYPSSFEKYIPTLINYFSIACHRMDFTTEIVNYHNAVKNRVAKEEHPEKKQRLRSKRVYSQYPAEFDKELDNALNWISPEDLVDVKYQINVLSHRTVHSALIIYRK